MSFLVCKKHVHIIPDKFTHLALYNTANIQDAIILLFSGNFIDGELKLLRKLFLVKSDHTCYIFCVVHGQPSSLNQIFYVLYDLTHSQQRRRISSNDLCLTYGSIKQKLLSFKSCQYCMIIWLYRLTYMKLCRSRINKCFSGVTYNE